MSSFLYRKNPCFFLLTISFIICFCIYHIKTSYAENQEKAVNIERIHIADQNSFSRIVIEVPKKSEYSFSAENNPNRIIIKLYEEINDKYIPYINKSIFIKNISYSKKDKYFEITILINPFFEIIKNFTLEKNMRYKNRIVIDFKPKEEIYDGQVGKLYNLSKRTNHYYKKGIILPAPKIKRSSYMTFWNPPLIVIDAGHGGHDPGALGKKLKEKDITLSYAQELKKQLLKTRKYNIYMIRDEDVFIPLSKRKRKAQEKNTNMFISLHANSSPKNYIEGISVYTLSENGSKKEAIALSATGNKSEIISDISLSKEDYNNISDILIDLMQRDTKNISALFAESLILNMQKERVKILSNPHRFAGFKVLKSAGTPSVLIELGYLTNRQEESRLSSSLYKKKLVKVITDTINDHFEKTNSY